MLLCMYLFIMLSLVSVPMTFFGPILARRVSGNGHGISWQSALCCYSIVSCSISFRSCSVIRHGILLVELVAFPQHPIPSIPQQSDQSILLRQLLVMA